MFDAKAEDLAELAADYHHHHNPADANQRFLVDTLVYNEWRLRRMRRVEAELWDTATNTFLAANTEAPACSSGDAFATAAPAFERLQRIVNSCERAYHRTLKGLEVARAHGLRSQEPGPGPAPDPARAPRPQLRSATIREPPPPAAPVSRSSPSANPTEIQPSTPDRDPDAPDAA